ncbi:MULTISPECIES: phage holin family protein [Paenibacillus]|uniref:Uncharacterized protein n=1 Tax=Paenibacillus borealis TaxID=160799 RepID=A0ABX3HMR6_PAEBO|nr:phage holin family protein [Paenibacillus borealis]OMD50795.1 hypothetical protein BSK56_06430 [Paenibacillus borealis]
MLTEWQTGQRWCERPKHSDLSGDFVSIKDLGVQTVGVIFGEQLAPEKYDQITAAVNAVLGILVVLGIVSNPEVGKGYTDKE